MLDADDPAALRLLDPEVPEDRGNSGIRELLRGLGSLQHPAPFFDLAQAPPSPETLFVSWLETAIAAGVVEPHAMVLSTVGDDGVPDARTLILKDLRDGDWWFATDVKSAKAAQLAANPVAALTFYWPTIGRQVRLRGHVRSGSAAENERDFLERRVSARALVAAVRSLPDDATREDLVAATLTAEGRLENHPELGSEAWRTYGLTPTEVEFWQADPGRLHQRLVYARTAGRWQRRMPPY